MVNAGIFSCTTNFTFDRPSSLIICLQAVIDSLHVSVTDGLNDIIVTGVYCML